MCFASAVCSALQLPAYYTNYVLTESVILAQLWLLASILDICIMGHMATIMPHLIL